jgi:hypothetical protein
MTTSVPATPTSSFVQREPALTYGGGLTGASLIIDAIVGVGIPLTDTTRIVIMLVVSVVGPLIGTLLTRQKVFSAATVATLKKDAETILGDVAHPEVTPTPDDTGKHSAP